MWDPGWAQRPPGWGGGTTRSPKRGQGCPERGMWDPGWGQGPPGRRWRPQGEDREPQGADVRPQGEDKDAQKGGCGTWDGDRDPQGEDGDPKKGIRIPGWGQGPPGRGCGTQDGHNDPKEGDKGTRGGGQGVLTGPQGQAQAGDMQGAGLCAQCCPWDADGHGGHAALQQLQGNQTAGQLCVHCLGGGNRIKGGGGAEGGPIGAGGGGLRVLGGLVGVGGGDWGS